MTAALVSLSRGFQVLIAWTSDAVWRRWLVIALVSLAVILPGLTALPVTDRDEARFAQATKQMLETGDYVDIRFQDEPRWKKPAGIYWLQAISVSAFGPEATGEIWAYRVPSAIAGFLAALATAWAAAPLIGGRGAAVAGLMTAAMLLMAVEANIAKTDATLLLCSVAVLGGLARMLAGTAGWGTAAVFWLAMSAGILVKGPVLPAVAVLALIWLAILLKFKVPVSRLKPRVGIVFTIAFVAPWLAAIWQISQGQFFEESVGKDLIGKILEGQEKHGAPPGFYLVTFWGTFWPWAALVPLAFPWIWYFRREVWLILLGGWIIPFWIVLEAVPTKLPHYVLPLYPAIAIALAAWAVSPHTEAQPAWRRWTSAVLTAVPGLGLAIVVIVLPLVLEGLVIWPAVGLAVAGGIATIAAAAAAVIYRPMAQIAAALIAAMTLYPAVKHHGLPALSTGFPSPRIAALNEQWRPCASGPLISVGYREPSLIFLTETGTQLANIRYAANAMEFDPGAYMLIESAELPRFEKKFGPVEGRLVPRAELSYFNYNRGRYETATLFTSNHSRWTGCAE